MSIRLFLGVPGTGKTLAMQDYVSAHSKEWPHFVVDRAGEWGPENVKRWRKGVPRTEVVPYGKIETVSRRLLDDVEPGVYLFQYPWEGHEVAQVAADVGNVVFCDDEIDLVATYSAVGGVSWQDNPLRSMCHRGRHLPNLLGVPCQLHILGAARRPQNLHTDLTSLCDEVLIFRVQGDKTVDRLVKEGMLGPDDVLKATTQPNFQYIKWVSTGGRVPGEIDAF